jgi:hypothetical protein
MRDDPLPNRIDTSHRSFRDEVSLQRTVGDAISGGKMQLSSGLVIAMVPVPALRLQDTMIRSA